MLENLTAIQYIFWGAAIISSVIFLLQTVMTLMGIGGDSADASGVDADTGLAESGVTSEAMQMFSLRNFVNFFIGFGWTGVCLESVIHNVMLLTLVAVGVGMSFVLLFMFIFKGLLKLEHSGNINLERDVVGQEADVYLVIRPGARGKVQLSVNGSVHEYDAVTADRTATIPTGARVRIINKVASDTLMVEPLA